MATLLIEEKDEVTLGIYKELIKEFNIDTSKTYDINGFRYTNMDYYTISRFFKDSGRKEAYKMWSMYNADYFCTFLSLASFIKTCAEFETKNK